MTRFIVVLTLVAAVAFGAGRLTASSDVNALRADRNLAAHTRAVPETAPAAAARQALQDAAPVLAAARTARDALRDQVATTDFGVLLDLAADAQGLASPAQRGPAMQTIIARMTELDPAAALDYAGKLTDDFSRRVAQTTVITGVAQTDAQLAIDMINGMARDNIKQPLYMTAIRAMALEDPVRALEISRSFPGHASIWVHQVYGQWGRYDPEGALAHSANLTEPGAKRSAQWSVAQAWLQSDQDAAVNWLEGASSTLGHDERENLLTLFAQTSPDLAERLATLASPRLRRQMLRASALTISQEDPAAAAQQFDELSAKDRRQVSAGSIAHSWAKKDRQAALNWAQQLTGEDRASAEHAIFVQWIREDSAAAMSYIGTLESSRQQQISKVIADQLSQTDPARAFDWLRARGAGERVDTEAMWSLAMLWSERDPAEAVATFAQHQGEPWSEHALQWSLRNLASSEPGEAKQWIARMTTDESRGIATRAVASGLAQIDRESALEWSRSLNGAARDNALAGIASTINNDPQRQYDIAQAIQNSQTRGETVRLAIFSMGRDNVELATQWLESADLDDFQHEELRRYLERR